ncbi:Uncharacterised protein [Mycobacteroides abscessus subsp. abscessus]|nr:Uncharacterised protein [Mycobacteroides abscessus subsp. abscessus]
MKSRVAAPGTSTIIPITDGTRKVLVMRYCSKVSSSDSGVKSRTMMLWAP